MRAILKALLFIALHCLLFSACASHESLYRAESTELVEKIGSSGAEELFPAEFSDLICTLGTAENLLADGNVDLADQYFLLLMGKSNILATQFLLALKRQEEEAIRQEELRKRAELEIQQELLREQEREQERVRERLSEAKRRESAKAEARAKAERMKAEKETPLAPRHTVRRGETLPQISAMQEVYGEASLWPLLYKANRDQISDPGVLWPGQVLRIPRNHDKGDLNEARRFAAERPLR